jgi:hypothetical protein
LIVRQSVAKPSGLFSALKCDSFQKNELAALEGRARATANPRGPKRIPLGGVPHPFAALESSPLAFRFTAFALRLFRMTLLCPA